MNAAAIALVLLAQAAPADSATAQGTAVLDRNSARIGERLTLTVSVDGIGEGDAVIFPELPDTGWVTGIGPPLISVSPAGTSYSARYEVATWNVGRLLVPLADVRIVSDSGERRVVLPEVAVDVISVLPADSPIASLAWKAPADVVGPNWSGGEKALAAVVSLLFLLGVLLLSRRRSRHRPIPVPAAKPPRERALAALARLETSGLPEAGELKAYYSALSEIVRDFLAESVPDWRRDLTTRELIAVVARHELSEAERETLRATLDDADCVKFARLRPSLAEAKLSAAAARRWIDGFEPPASRSERLVEADVAAAVGSAELESLIDLDAMFAGGGAGEDQASGADRV